MAKKEQVADYTPAMSDAVARLKTGKSWAQWFAVLDRAGAAGLTHRVIARMLSEQFDVGPWWSQMVTVEYERSRGLRQKYQTVTGYSVSVSKTIGCGLPALYAATAEARLRRRWIPEGFFKISSRTENKYLRGSWNDARIEMGFIGKGAARSQISAQIGKLAKKSEVEPARTVWKDALVRLEALVKGS